MANDNAKSVAKNGLPFLIAGTLCGYATDAIPALLDEGSYRDWAYRSIPFISLIIMFIIRTLKDFGGMSFVKLLFTICATPEKKNLKMIMQDTHASEEIKNDARKRYDQILKKELEIGSRLLSYISQWSIFKKAPTPPETIE